MAEQDECTFLCGYQRTRGYGSLSNPYNSRKTYSKTVRHQVMPNDTLQGIVLRYNTSMSEIKRLNHLWSNESLHLKSYVDVPVYGTSDITNAPSTSSPPLASSSRLSITTTVAAAESESAQDIFKRIDVNIAKSARAVHKLTKNSSEGNIFEEDLGKRNTEGRCSLKLPAGYQNSRYQC